MMKVKIIRGFYGLKTARGVRVMSPAEPAFELTNAEARRLIALKVVAPVEDGEDTVTEPAEGTADNTRTVEEPDDIPDLSAEGPVA